MRSTLGVAIIEPTDIQPAFQFILASSSARRRDLLRGLGVPFPVVPPGGDPSAPGVDERPLPGERPAALVQRLSRLKAESVAKGISPFSSAPPSTKHQVLNIILSADTVVVFKDRILGKPNDPAEANRMLKLLRQQPHSVYSGLTVAYPGLPGAEWQFTTRLHQSKVWMRAYTDAEIQRYVAGGSPLDKAGAYGIQDLSFAPVERLEGCFASVMGLPLGELAAALQEINLSLPKVAPRCSEVTGATCCLSTQTGQAVDGGS